MIHPRVQLVTADFVGTLHGLSTEAVYKRVDTDEGWMWVFNAGTGTERALRFWKREQVEPLATRCLHLEEVIRQIVPPRQLSGGWQKWEVADLLRLSRRRLMELNLNFQPRNGGLWLPQAELTHFFRTRWLYTEAYAVPKLL
jgi:hypothetical protein